VRQSGPLTITSSQTGRTIPVEGVVYADHGGATLKVTAIDEEARDGREVIGVIEPTKITTPRVGDHETASEALDRDFPVSETSTYATTVDGWRRRWHERQPPTGVRTLKVG